MGPGIPPEQFANVLHPFVRLEPSRNLCTGGAGPLGSCCRSLAEASPSAGVRHHAARPWPQASAQGCSTRTLISSGRLSANVARCGLSSSRAEADPSSPCSSTAIGSNGSASELVGMKLPSAA